MKTKIGFVSLTFLTLGLGLLGCASKSSQMGVKNFWRTDSIAAFEKGKTTQSEVMTVLGPPSQVIGLRDQTIFYYLREESKTKGMYLVIYNQTREQIAYDRAIFFFDDQGVLKDFALSDERIPLK